MNADQLQSAISLARSLFGTRHRFWAKALADPLEHCGCMTPLFWAISLYTKALGEREFSPSLERHESWLAEAKDLARNGSISPEYCGKKALQIWNNDHQFNRFERGISRIFSALQFLAEKNIEEYRRQVISSVVMLSDRDDEGFDSTTLETAISDFQKIVSSS